MSSALGDLIDETASDAASGVKTWIPGEVVAYDAKHRWAQVKANARLIRVENGEEVEKTIPVAWMPVAFHQSGGFIVASDVVKGDRGRIYYSHVSLEKWKGDGKEYATKVGQVNETDAVFVPGLTDYANPGVVVPAGQMIAGAENGPGAHALEHQRDQDPRRRARPHRERRRRVHPGPVG